MKIQKLFQAGNSLVVAIPPEIVKEVNARKGDICVVSMGEGGKVVINFPDPQKLNRAMMEVK